MKINPKRARYNCLGMAKSQTLMDKVGMAASSVCALHCALAPLLITLAPLVGLGFLFEESFEIVFMLGTIGLAFLSIAWSFIKTHQNILPFFLFLLGAAIFYIGHQNWVLTDIVPHPLLMAMGGLSIAISHYINLKLCNHCDNCHHH